MDPSIIQLLFLMKTTLYIVSVNRKERNSSFFLKLINNTLFSIITITIDKELTNIFIKHTYTKKMFYFAR